MLVKGKNCEQSYSTARIVRKLWITAFCAIVIYLVMIFNGPSNSRGYKISGSNQHRQDIKFQRHLLQEDSTEKVSEEKEFSGATPEHHTKKVHRSSPKTTALTTESSLRPPTGTKGPNCTPPAYHEFPPDMFSNKGRARGGIIVHFLVVFYMFYALAVVCDCYFVSSLEECCERLNLSADVAGATFMAAGSSAPELFTALLGVFIAKGDVGTGTIVGSAVFNILFVIGVCALLAGSPVDLTWWPVFRDSTYYAFTVIVLIFVIYDSSISVAESVFMLILYFVYIIIMKFNTQIHTKVAEVFHIQESDLSGGVGILANANDTKTYSSYAPFQEDDDLEKRVSAPPIPSRVPLDEVIRDSPPKKIPMAEACLMIMMSRHFRPKTRFRAAGRKIICQYQRQKQQRLPQQSSMDPSYMLRQRSMSVAVTSDEEKWRRIPDKDEGILEIAKWAIKVPLLAALYYTVPDCRKERFKKYFLVTFFVSILWTAVFSYFMVWMVTVIGYTFGVPDSIMGITFLAAGTSIPDAYASLIVAKQGRGDMAVSNSIGSNVFDILIGLALPWFLKTACVEPGTNATINSRGLVYSVVLLFLTIIITIVGIHFSKWQLTRNLGILLLVVYAIFLIFAICLEYNVVLDVALPLCVEDD